MQVSAYLLLEVLRYAKHTLLITYIYGRLSAPPKADTGAVSFVPIWQVQKPSNTKGVFNLGHLLDGEVQVFLSVGRGDLSADSSCTVRHDWI